MCKIIFLVVIVSAASVTAAISTRGIAGEHVSDRSLRIGGSSSVTTATDTPSNGLSVSFVPLFSLLANFIPRILSRFNGVNAYKARSLRNPSRNTEIYNDSDGQLCNTTHLGQWADATNCRQFYICLLNSNCSTATSGNEILNKPHGEQDAGEYIHVGTISTNCTTMKIFQCQGASVYNSNIQKCEPKVSSSIVCEQR